MRTYKPYGCRKYIGKPSQAPRAGYILLLDPEFSRASIWRITRFTILAAKSADCGPNLSERQQQDQLECPLPKAGNFIQFDTYMNYNELQWISMNYILLQTYWIKRVESACTSSLLRPSVLWKTRSRSIAPTKEEHFVFWRRSETIRATHPWEHHAGALLVSRAGACSQRLLSLRWRPLGEERLLSWQRSQQTAKKRSKGPWLRVLRSTWFRCLWLQLLSINSSAKSVLIQTWFM